MLTTIDRKKYWRNLFFGAASTAVLLFLMVMTPQLNLRAEAATNNRTFSDEGDCRDRAAVVNTSFATATACNNCTSKKSDRWGTVWINMDSTSNYSEGTDQRNKQRDEIVLIGYLDDGDDDYETDEGASVEVNKGRFTAYLHGQAVSCGGTDTNPSSMNAKNVYFVDPTGSNGISKYTDGKNFYRGVGKTFLENKEVNFILNQNIELERIKPDGTDDDGNPTFNNLPRYTWSKTGAPTPITIDMYKFSKYVNSRVKQYEEVGYGSDDERRFCTKQEGDDRTKSSCYIGIFRCPNSASGPSSDSCWANSTKITLDLLDGLDEFHGQIKILDQDNMSTTFAKNNYENKASYGSAATNNGLETVPKNKDYILKEAGTANSNYVVLDMQLTNTKWHKIRVNNFLKVDGSGSSNWEIYNGNTMKASGTDTPTNAGGHKISQWDLCARAKGNNEFDFYLAPYKKGQSCKDEVVVNESYKVATSNIKDGNMTCFTLKYQNHSDYNPNDYQYRSACIRLSSPVTLPKVQGRIAVSSATGQRNDAKLSAQGQDVTTTGYESSNSTYMNSTKNYEFPISGTTKDVYAHWRFDVKADKNKDDEGNAYKMAYRRVKCISENTDCRSWLESLNITRYNIQFDGVDGAVEAKVFNANDVATGSTFSGTSVTHMSYSMDISDAFVGNNGGPLTYRDGPDTPEKYADALKNGKELYVCYKFFVAPVDNSVNLTENSVWNTSVACTHFASSTASNSVQGRIAVSSSADTKGSAKQSAQGQTVTVTEYSTGSYELNESERNTHVFADGETTKSVYAHWRFDIKAGSYQDGQGNTLQAKYKRVKCESRTDDCITWLQNLDLKRFSNQGSWDGAEAKVFTSSGESTGATISGTIVNKKENNNYDLTSAHTGSDGANVNWIKEPDEAATYSNALEKEKEYYVCYKFFVAPKGASSEDDSAWNTSIACTHFKSDSGSGDEGEAYGEITLNYQYTAHDGVGEGRCTVQDNASQTGATSSTAGNFKVIKRNSKTNETEDETDMIISCAEDTISHVAVSFSHTVGSDGQAQQTKFRGWHREQSGDSNPITKSLKDPLLLPSDAPGIIARAVYKSKKNSDDTYSWGTSNSYDGRYTIYEDQKVCETLQVGEGKKMRVCAILKLPGETGPLSGKSYVTAVENASTDSSITCEGIGTSVSEETTRVNYEEKDAAGHKKVLTVSCKSDSLSQDEGEDKAKVTFEFAHDSQGDNIENNTRHCLYHSGSQCIAWSSSTNQHDKYDSFGPLTLKTQSTGGNSYSVNGNGQYTIGVGSEVCESQLFGEYDTDNGKNMYSRVCVKVEFNGGGEADGCGNLATAYGESATQVDSADSGRTYLISFIRNTDISRYSDYATNKRSYSNFIYAKPTDNIDFYHCYHNGAQSVRTTKYWDILTSKEHKPESLTSTVACTEEYNEGDSVPTACSEAVTFSMEAGSGTNTDWINYDQSGSSYTDYTVTDKTHTLVEANYTQGGAGNTNNYTYNTYSVSTEYPNSNNQILGNGVEEGAVSMTYTWKDNTGSAGTGSEGKVDQGIAQNVGGTTISVGAPGGTLKQTSSALTGTLTRKSHLQTWSFDFSYKFAICKHPKKDDGTIDEEKCNPESDGTVSKDSSDAGSGSGDHGSIYYERDEDNTTFTSTSYTTNSLGVYVPYNYKVSAEIEIDKETNSKIFSGESFNLKSAYVYINPTPNRITTNYGSDSEAYATIAPDLTVEMYAYISRNDESGTTGHREGFRSGSLSGCSYYLADSGLECVVLDNATKTFNHTGNYNGTKSVAYREDAFSSFRKTYNAFDYVAGKYLCVGIGVNKWRTDDSAINGVSGNEIVTNEVYYSNASCAQIYKKPTFAVWGAGIFSNGNIKANILEKNNVANYNPYQKISTAYRVSFSSWVEGIVVANGDVEGVASGAATAYTLPGDSSTGYAPIAAPGGINSADYCLVSALTIANTSCSEGKSGGAEVPNRTGVKEEIIRRYIEPNYDLTTNTIRPECGQSPRLECHGGDEVSGFSADYGKAFIFASKDSITIDEDVIYKNDRYASANQVSQIIVYSKGDITIKGNVKNLSGVYIAEGKINTCDEINSSDSTPCHNPLRIDGSIIGNVIELNRLYGAAVGSNSIIPAEIINHSPSIYLWSSYESGSTINSNIVETYSRELPPRQ